MIKEKASGTESEAEPSSSAQACNVCKPKFSDLCPVGGRAEILTQT